ncbi:AAA family ATPase [Halotalea alkalilenta]|uniref:AAA family ATPase n=1 Tax=Halotalea alkalilenta TaxID=376489 RepID=UPI0004838DB4|nr:ATP-binding protein [Halotalea alkalilenta]
MLKSLDIHALTLFPSVTLTFSPGLNIIVGENGAGKTHLLKAAYSLLAVSAQSAEANETPTKSFLQKALADKLVGVFRPDSLGRLASRRQGRSRCHLAAQFQDKRCNLALSFASNAENQVAIEAAPTAWLDKLPVYLPTRELLSLYPGFISMYRNQYVDFEETWYDTSLLLGRPGIRGVKEKQLKELLTLLEDAMGGRVEQDRSGRFYFKPESGARIEIPLVAEGLRKLAMLARLVVTGSLLDKGYLFWDEPEANLNPRLIKRIAQVLVALSKQGIQIFIATHSLFLLRELEILQTEAALEARYFALAQSENFVVHVQQGNSLDDVGPLVLLDEEVQQGDRFLALGEESHV